MDNVGTRVGYLSHGKSIRSPFIFLMFPNWFHVIFRCYVGTGPSRDIWRTCKRNQPSTTIQYLHEKNPPAVYKLNGSEPLGNLCLSDAVDLLEEKSKQKLQELFILPVLNNEDKETKIKPSSSNSRKNETVASVVKVKG